MVQLFRWARWESLWGKHLIGSAFVDVPPGLPEAQRCVDPEYMGRGSAFGQSVCWPSGCWAHLCLRAGLGGFVGDLPFWVKRRGRDESYVFSIFSTRIVHIHLAFLCDILPSCLISNRHFNRGSIIGWCFGAQQFNLDYHFSLFSDFGVSRVLHSYANGEYHSLDLRGCQQANNKQQRVLRASSWLIPGFDVLQVVWKNATF